MAEVATEIDPKTGEPIKDVDRPAYKYACALTETARASHSVAGKRFKHNWDFLLGKNHWAAPATAAAFLVDEWACKSVRNWLFATVDNKNAVVNNAKPQLHVEPLDEGTTYLDRAKIHATLMHELTRLKWDRVLEKMYLHGSVNGIGVALVSTKPDPMSITGQLQITLSAIDPRDVFLDPKADSLDEADYVVWEPLLDMSVIRAMFPSKANQVKPETQTISGATPQTTVKPDNSDDNLIYGQGQEFEFDAKGIRTRKARVAFVWVREDSVIEEEREKSKIPAQEGLKCVSCGAFFEDGALIPQEGVPEPEEGPKCPVCQGNLVPETLPEKVETETVFRKPYPYGRLIVKAKGVLFFDGPNPEDIETVYPMALYHHYDLPGQKYFSDVDLGKSPQEVADVTVGQLVDYVRLGVNGPFEFPANEPAYAELGNGPAQRIPCKPQNMNLAHYVTPQGFNTQAWEALDRTTQHDFGIVLGTLEPGQTQPGSAPVSATESGGVQRAVSTRIGSHIRRRDRAASELASIVYQMMHQHYGAVEMPDGEMAPNPMTVPIRLPSMANPAQSEVQAIAIEVQMLPKNVKIQVTSDIAEIEKNKNMGQQIAGLSQAGIIPPDLDLLLPASGISPAITRQIMERQALAQELMGAQAQPQAPPQGPQPEPQMNGGR